MSEGIRPGHPSPGLARVVSPTCALRDLPATGERGKPRRGHLVVEGDLLLFVPNAQKASRTTEVLLYALGAACLLAWAFEPWGIPPVFLSMTLIAIGLVHGAHANTLAERSRQAVAQMSPGELTLAGQQPLGRSWPASTIVLRARKRWLVVTAVLLEAGGQTFDVGGLSLYWMRVLTDAMPHRGA